MFWQKLTEFSRVTFNIHLFIKSRDKIYRNILFSFDSRLNVRKENVNILCMQYGIILAVKTRE